VSQLYRIILLGFKYYVGLHTHLWKVATTYSWRHAELHMEQHVREMRQIRQSHGTRLTVVCLTYIYLRDQRDKGFRSYKIEDKMNKALRSDLEDRGNLLETMMAEMGTFKVAKYATGGGEQSFNMVCFHCGTPGLHTGGKKLCQWKDLSQAEAREKGLRFVTNARQAAN
jgi:uncharacterized protein with GYD domain